MNIFKLKAISVMYLLLPILIFFLGWLRVPYSLLFGAMIIIANYAYFKRERENGTDSESIISNRDLTIVLVLSLIWCFLAGQGCYYYQSTDHHARNAIFRDLILYDWPVIYAEQGYGLVYYLAFWIVPAMFGKLGGMVSPELAWSVGNFALLIWCTIGVFLTIIWCLHILKKKNTKAVLAVFFLIVFFSGLDIMGAIYSPQTIFERMHIEWWAWRYQYSSMTTQLFWVFNQAVPAWIVTAMMLDEKSISNYCYIILLLLPFGPFPFVGLAIIFIIKGLDMVRTDYIAKKRYKAFFKDALSIQNVLSIFSVLLVFALYYMDNRATNDNPMMVQSFFVVPYIGFILCEALIYCIIVFIENRKNLMYYIVTISLCVIPLITMGEKLDFCMRASIPALFILMLYVIDFLLKYIGELKNPKSPQRTLVSLLILVFSLGSITPIIEFSRGFNAVMREKKLAVVADDWVTVPGTSDSNGGNFSSKDIEETIFFKYLGRQ